jgi:hypothetical protein
MAGRGPSGMMSERTIRGMLNAIANQLKQRIPPEKLVKVLDHQARLEGQLRAVEKLRIEKELSRRGQETAG